MVLRICAVGLSLCFGMAVTVGVAWGCAWRAQRAGAGAVAAVTLAAEGDVIQLVDRVAPGCRQIDWIPQSWEAWKWSFENARTHPRERDTSFRFEQRWVPVVIPAWVPSWAPLDERQQTPDRHVRSTMLAAGWPLPALACEVYDHQPLTSPDRLHYQVRGGIAMDQPADQLAKRLTAALPLSPVPVGFVANTLCAAMVPGVVFFLIHRVRARRRALVGCCPGCGYNLGGAGGRCPECGRERLPAPTQISGLPGPSAQAGELG